MTIRLPTCLPGSCLANSGGKSVTAFRCGLHDAGAAVQLGLERFSFEQLTVDQHLFGGLLLLRLRYAHLHQFFIDLMCASACPAFLSSSPPPQPASTSDVARMISPNVRGGTGRTQANLTYFPDHFKMNTLDNQLVSVQISVYQKLQLCV